MFNKELAKADAKLSTYQKWINAAESAEDYVLRSAAGASADSSDLPPMLISRVYLGNNDLVIYLSYDSGKKDNGLKRSFVRRLMELLVLDKINRLIDQPGVLQHEVEFSPNEVVFDTKNSHKATLQIHNYICDYSVTCEKTCYAVSADGTKRALVKNASVEETLFEAASSEL